jgi:hypothetical protein
VRVHQAPLAHRAITPAVFTHLKEYSSRRTRDDVAIGDALAARARDGTELSVLHKHLSVRRHSGYARAQFPVSLPGVH